MLTQLTVEAARQRPTTAPQWWMRKSKNQQEQYLKKHPNSYLKDFLKKADVVRKKKAAPVPSLKRKQKAKIENKRSRLEAERRPKRPPNNRKKARGKAAVHGERQRRDEEKRLAESLHTGIRKSFIENLREIADKTSYIADDIKSKMSPSSKSKLSEFMREKKSGVEPNEAGRKVANKVLLSVTHALLGAALVASVMTGAAPLAGAVTAAFLGLRDYRKSLEGTKHEGVDLTEEEPEEDDIEAEGSDDEIDQEEDDGSDEDYSDEDEDEDLESTSAYDEDDSNLDELIQSYVDWLGNQDIDAITEKFAEYAAIEKMEKSGWAPTPANMTDEELDDLEAEDDSEGQLTSESGIGPRVTFKLDSSLVRKQPELRNTFNVMCQNRKIGRVYTDDSFASKKKRIWKIELSDGFNESAYHSGRQENAPFTIVKNGEVLLKNHYPSTFIECCNWVRSNIDKNYL